MVIGICDDSEKDISIVEDMCKKYFGENSECSYVHFTSGKEVLDYANNKEKMRIDLLFLDIEMDEVDGIRVKNELMKNNMIWRIVFVTGVDQKEVDAFGLKVIGYIQKPATQEKIDKYIAFVKDEIESESLFYVEGLGKNVPRDIKLEDVLYFKADGSYTRMYAKNGEYLISKRIKLVEELVQGYPFVRVHKSFIVNMMNIKEIKTEICIKGHKDIIPVGKLYSKSANEVYCDYIRHKMRRII